MKLIVYSFIIGALAFSTQSYCQHLKTDWFILPGGNLYLPSGSSNKGIYPILWYDKTTNPKMLIGGLGVGVSFIKTLTPKLSWRGQGNLSKHTYWDEPIIERHPVGIPLGTFFAGSSDYTVGLTTTIHYSLINRLSIGTGIGGQFLLVSLSRLPEVNNYNGPAPGPIVVNHYYRPILPVLPLEVAFKINKAILVNVRYEYSLINRIRGDLNKVKTDRSDLLTFELGLKLK